MTALAANNFISVKETTIAKGLLAHLADNSASQSAIGMIELKLFRDYLGMSGQVEN